MARATTRTSGWRNRLNGRPSDTSRRRSTAAVYGMALVALLPAFLWWAPAVHAPPVALTAGLLALALGTAAGEIALKRTLPVQFFSVGGIVVILLVVAGPLAAFVAWLLPDLASRARRHKRVLTPGFAANVASYGWSSVAGAAVLALAHAGHASPRLVPAVLAAAFVVELVNFMLARAVYGSLYQGLSLRAMIGDELLPMLRAELAMCALAAIAALLIAPLGVATLLLLAPLVLGPQLVLPALARSRSVATLSPLAATQLYVNALCTHLAIDRRTRRIALAAAELVEPKEPRRARLQIAIIRSLPFSEIHQAAFHVRERWDGRGSPAGLPGSAIPAASRLLAVASTWSMLTARGEHRLPQAHALLALEMESALRLDPQLVRAAGEIVTTEAAFAQLENFRPSLHRIPVPRTVRAGALPRTLAGYGAAVAA